MVLQDPLLGWQQYPHQNNKAHDDAHHYRTLLEQKADSIFTTDPSNTRLEVIHTQASGTEQSKIFCLNLFMIWLSIESTSRNVVDSLQDLEVFMRVSERPSIYWRQKRLTKVRDVDQAFWRRFSKLRSATYCKKVLITVSFLSQKNTRSRLQLTLEMFCLLCHANRIMPRYIDIVASFGYKSLNSDEYFMTCYRDIHLNEEDSYNCNLYAGYGMIKFWISLITH